MLNRYSNLPKSTIINTQVLTDLGVIDTALQRQQKVYDNQAAGIAKTAQAANDLSFVGDAANGFKDKLNEDLKSKVNDWSKLDLADPNVKAEVNGYISSLASNPELQKHTKAKLAYDNYVTQVQDLDNKGKFHDSNAYAFEKAWKDYKTTGNFNEGLTSASIMEAQEPTQEAKKFFENMKADSSEDVKAIRDLAGTAYYENGYEALSKGKLTGRAKQVALEWLQTPATKQLVNDFNMMKDKGVKLPYKTAQDYALATLFDTANSYAYSKSSTNKSGALNKLEDRNYTNSKEEETILTGTEGFNNPNFDSNQKFNPDGSMRTSSTVASWALGTLMGNQNLTEEDLKDSMKQTIRLGAITKGITEEAYYDKYAKKLEIPVWNYVKETPRTNLTSLLSKNGAGLINSAKVITIDGKVGTLKDIIQSKYGELSQEDLDDKLKQMQVTGKVESSAISASGYRISLDGEDLILDITPGLQKKVESNTATAKEVQQLTKHIQEKFKAGYVEDLGVTDEGRAIQFWNEDLNEGKGGLDVKLID